MSGQVEARGVRLEELDQRVLVQQEFTGVDRVGRTALHAGHFIEAAQIQERLGVRAAAAAEPVKQGRFLIYTGIGPFRRRAAGPAGRPSDWSPRRCPPGRGQHQGVPAFMAAVRPARSSRWPWIVRRGADPGPDTAGKHRRRRELRVLIEGIGILRFLGLVIVPVDQRHRGSTAALAFSEGRPGLW